MPTTFRLGEILEERGIAQAELARQTGLSLQTINRLCRNRTAQVSLETLDAIATALGVAPGDLIVKETPKRKR